MNRPYNEVFSKNDTTPVAHKLQKGINIIADAVGSTFGPAGNTVIINTNYAGVIATKDGVTVAKSIDLKDDVENTGAQLIKRVANKTVDEAGDGTTTATILAQALFNEGLKILPFVRNRNELKRSINKFTEQVVDYIKSKAIHIELNKDGENIELFNIAKLSANGDEEMAKAIVDAFKLVGEEGIISVDDGTKDGYEVEQITGLKVDAGLAHPYFMTDERKLECEQSNSIILLVKDGITSFLPFKMIFEDAAMRGKALTVISDNFTDAVISIALQNKLKGRMDLSLIRVQGYGANKDAIFEDIAVITNATIIDKNTDEKMYQECLGKATKVISNKNETRFICDDRDEDRFNTHLEKLNTMLEQTVNSSDKEKIETRISKLVGGVATIRVSGKSEEEVHEIKDRLDDAVNAVRSALEEGYVIGGGTVFFEATDHLVDDGSDGYRVITEALRAPLRMLCSNAGESYDYAKTLLRNREDESLGINFSKEKIELSDLIQEGVIDPAKVLRVSLQSAVSIVGLLLTSDYLVTLVLPENPNNMM